MQTVVVKFDGREVGRFSGECFQFGKRVDPKAGMHSETLVDDPKMMKLVVEGKTVLVFMVSCAENVTVERV